MKIRNIFIYHFFRELFLSELKFKSFERQTHTRLGVYTFRAHLREPKCGPARIRIFFIHDRLDNRALEVDHFRP
jgi:hypothetical protein